jgi:hypothetical protein
MIRWNLCRCCLSLLAVFAATPALASAASTAASPKHESPFACVESALSPAERKQHFEEYGPRLRARLQRIQELPNGYEFAFENTPETYRTLSAWMFQERLCCPFFDLELRIDREGGPLWLKLTGREGVKQFITAEFDPWFRRSAR